MAHLAHQVKRISVVQQGRVQWVTLAIGTIPPEGADEVPGGLVSRVIWGKGGPLDDHGDGELPQPWGGQARPLSPGMASGPVALLSI